MSQQRYLVPAAAADRFIDFGFSLDVRLRRETQGLAGLPGQVEITGRATAIQDQRLRAWITGVTFMRTSASSALSQIRNALDLAQAALPDGTERDRCLEGLRLLDEMTGGQA